ncbi:hypothetical protein ACWGRV_14205 [Streptomyces sp. NPDC055663]
MTEREIGLGAYPPRSTSAADDGVDEIEECADDALDDPPSAPEPLPAAPGLPGYQFRFRPMLRNRPIS